MMRVPGDELEWRSVLGPDGKFAEWWITWDNLTILGQLGHLPAE